jgi:plastocyanin
MPIILDRRTLLAALPVAALPIAATRVRAAEAAIGIDNFSFTPATLTVPAGTTVVWTNHDDIPHAVVSDAAPPLFRSPVLDTGEVFKQSFAKPGTYRYFCSLHPHMQGTVVVT